MGECLLCSGCKVAMVYKSLVRLIDKAVLPAALLLSSKILGVIGVNYIYHLGWSFTSTGLVFYSQKDFVLANSYSSLFMFAVIFLGLLFTLIQALFFHDSHIAPNMAVFLKGRGWEYLIKGGFEVYSAAFVWLSYAWLTTVILFYQNSFGALYSWVLYICFAVSFVATLMVLLDIELELLLVSKVKESRRSVLPSFFDISSVIKKP